MKLRVEEKSYGIRLTSPRNGTGHGDTFSAFAVALLVAHEAAGKRRMIVGAMSGSGIDPWEAAMARLDRERDELAQWLGQKDQLADGQMPSHFAGEKHAGPSGCGTKIVSRPLDGVPCFANVAGWHWRIELDS